MTCAPYENRADKIIIIVVKTTAENQKKKVAKRQVALRAAKLEPSNLSLPFMAHAFPSLPYFPSHFLSDHLCVWPIMFRCLVNIHTAYRAAVCMYVHSPLDRVMALKLR